MWTPIPPTVLPWLGLTASTISGGGGALVYVNWSATLVGLVPTRFVTVICTVVPSAPGGLLAPIALSPLGKKQGPNTVGPHGTIDVAPNATAVAPVKPLPTICRPVPPATGP